MTGSYLFIYLFIYSFIYPCVVRAAGNLQASANNLEVSLEVAADWRY